MRTMQDWLDSYSADHRNPINQRLHWLCVPPIVWTVIALLWTIPVPARFLQPGAWAVLAMFLAFAWYWKRSHRLGIALLAAFVLLALFTALLFHQLGAQPALAGTGGLRAGLDRPVHRPPVRRPAAEFSHRPVLPAGRAGLADGKAACAGWASRPTHDAAAHPAQHPALGRAVRLDHRPVLHPDRLAAAALERARRHRVQPRLSRLPAVDPDRHGAGSGCGAARGACASAVWRTARLRICYAARWCWTCSLASRCCGG